MNLLMPELKLPSVNTPLFALKPTITKWPRLDLQLLCLTSRYVTNPLLGEHRGPALHFTTFLSTPVAPPAPRLHIQTLEPADNVHLPLAPP